MESTQPHQQTKQPAPTNGRAESKLQVNHEGRKPLFGSSTSSHDDSKTKFTKASLGQSNKVRSPSAPSGSSLPHSSRRTNSESRIPNLGARSNGSPAASRHAKPSITTASSHRRPLSLAEAFKLAEDEEHLQLGVDDDQDLPMDGSPSPAPRPWRTRSEIDQNSIRKQLGKDHLDTKGIAAKGKESPSKDGERRSPIKFGDRPAIFNSPRKNGKPSSSTSDGAAWRDRPDWRARLGMSDDPQIQSPTQEKPDNEGADIPDLVPGIDDDVPLPSVETDDAFEWRQKGGAAENASPEKSFAWQVDEDFTAGDLQVSDSPRIKMNNRPFANRLPFDDSSNIDINSRTRVNNPGSRNTKLDEIRSREVKAGGNVYIETSPAKPRNTKLDEIRSREVEAESKIPIPERHITTLRNTKLDDIRQREIDGVSKRQAAAARLDEIKEQNAMPRSVSPDEKRLNPIRPSSAESQPVEASGSPEAKPEAKLEPKPESPARAGSYTSGGVRIPDTPVTVYKGRQQTNGAASNAAANDRGNANKDDQTKDAEVKRPVGTNRRDSRDLLQRLARAASASPGPEAEVRRAVPGRKPDRGLTDTTSSTNTRVPRRSLLPPNNTANRRRATARDGKQTETKISKPSVGFVGLRRVRSTESTGSKRSSIHSEADPTDRIEAEMKLFAPMDNHSERGSVRGPSPAPETKSSDEDEAAEATPRARKHDPLSMPTPRVIGAFVETPAVDKVKDFDEDLPSKGHLALSKERKRGMGLKLSGRDTASDPGSEESDHVQTKRPPAFRRRAQSLPRIRPPLKNSAKLFSVKDDLKELQRLHNIEDSTVDDMEEIIAGRKAPTPAMEDLLKDIPSGVAIDADDTFDLKMERSVSEQQNFQAAEKLDSEVAETKITGDDEPIDNDLAAYERITKSLASSLHGIRDAKKGMERLEDNLSGSRRQPQPEKTDVPTEHQHTHDHDHHTQCASCAAQPNPNIVAYVHLPVPRLYITKPRLRLTALGFITLFLAIWYTLESGMCAVYCSPTSCSSPPCIWSYDDPSFGTALPVKIDQWTTGGIGRDVFNQVAEEVEDWLADVLDSAYGRDIRDVNVAALSFKGKRAHRRRLKKKGLQNGTRHLENATPEVRSQWDALHAEKLSQEKAREMGYDIDDDGYDTSIGEDQRVW